MKTILTILLLGFSFICSAQEPILIGLNADLSAVAKEGGIAIQRGATIAIEEINEAGGVLNRPLKLIIKNHRGNPARGVNNIKQLSTLTDLVAVIGGVHTPVALKELPIVHEKEIIYLDPWAAGTPIVDNGYQPNFVFRVSVRDEEAAKIMIPHAKQKGITRVGLLLERTGWGRSNEKSLSAAALEHQVEIADIAWFNWGQKNVDKEINILTKKGAQAIILVANVPEGVTIVETMLKQNVKLPIISHWGIASGNFVEQVGLSSLQKLDISVLQTYSFAKPHNIKLNAAILKRYQEKYGKDITASAIPGATGTAHAYDLVYLLANAITAAKTTERAKIRNELEQLPAYNGLVKNYNPAFTKAQHDALLNDDYIMSAFDHRGNLVPIQE
ncbi:MAG: ABC transporter substrate-binding protein [Thalassotalea sp.]